MGKIAMQIAVYIGLLLVFSTFTVISPFYPKVAKDKGLSIWLIGFVFAMNPIGDLTITPILGRYMYKLGRKNVVIASYIFTGLSMLILSPIELCDTNVVIFLSLFSRFIGGIGASCMSTTITTIFISDYPDEIQSMIAKMEVFIGIGLSMGPVIGAGLYFINLFAALAIVGGLILLFVPVAWKMLGTFRDYEIKEMKISQLPLLIKPVFAI